MTGIDTLVKLRNRHDINLTHVGGQLTRVTRFCPTGVSPSQMLDIVRELDRMWPPEHYRLRLENAEILEDHLKLVFRVDPRNPNQSELEI